MGPEGRSLVVASPVLRPMTERPRLSRGWPAHWRRAEPSRGGRSRPADTGAPDLLRYADDHGMDCSRRSCAPGGRGRAGTVRAARLLRGPDHGGASSSWRASTENARRAARALKLGRCDIAESTLRRWKDAHASRYAEIRARGSEEFLAAADQTVRARPGAGPDPAHRPPAPAAAVRRRGDRPADGVDRQRAAATGVRAGSGRRRLRARRHGAHLHRRRRPLRSPRRQTASSSSSISSGSGAGIC
jgi:hypothetical protein